MEGYNSYQYRINSSSSISSDSSSSSFLQKDEAFDPTRVNQFKPPPPSNQPPSSDFLQKLANDNSYSRLQDAIQKNIEASSSAWKDLIGNLNNNSRKIQALRRQSTDLFKLINKLESWCQQSDEKTPINRRQAAAAYTFEAIFSEETTLGAFINYLSLTHEELVFLNETFSNEKKIHQNNITEKDHSVISKIESSSLRPPTDEKTTPINQKN